jgi:sugar O-acyltransferase (sialic acid O-acetyltransferase NeuD family)
VSLTDLVVFGTGDIAELAHFYFRHDSPHRVVAFTVDAPYLKEPKFGGLPVVSFDEIAARFPPNRHTAFVALSYTQVNAVRAEKCAGLRALGYRLVSYVSSRATVFSDFRAGDNCFILEDNTVQPRVRIGNNVTLWSGNHIGHHSTIEDDVFVSSHVVISGGVTVGAGSFLGVNSTIRDHVRIGRRCVIGAGAVILSDAPDESVFAASATERSPVPSTRLRRI